MAAPTYIGNSGFAIAINALNIFNVNQAGNTAGDANILAVETANQFVAAPTGYVETAASGQGQGTAGAAGGIGLQTFIADYSAVSGQSSVAVADGGDHQSGVVLGVRGGAGKKILVNAAAGGVATVAAGGTISLPAVTTTVPDCLIVHVIGIDRDANSTTSVSSWANAGLTSVTEAIDQTSTTGAGGGLAIAYGAKAAAGAIGTTTATNNTGTSIAIAMITLALQAVDLPSFSRGYIIG